MSRQKAPNQLRPFWAMAYYSLKSMVRNRATFIFGFVFPLVFIGFFGIIGNNGASISIGIPTGEQTGPLYQALNHIDVIKIQSGTKTDLEKKVSQGQLGGLLAKANSTDTTPTLYTSAANPADAGAVQSLVSGIVDKLNLQLSGITKPPLTLKTEEVSGREFRYIDFALPGLIGFALISTAVTGVAFGLVFLKKALVLKRVFATPTKGLTILLAQGAARLVIVLAQTLVILGVGILTFHFQVIHGWLTVAEMLILSTIGLAAFLGFGLVIAGISSDENAVAPAANLVVLPQFLLAGTFFPTDNLPHWLQPIASNLPLAFFNDAMRKITVEGQGFNHIFPQLGGLFIWGVIAYLLAARTFKWE